MWCTGKKYFVETRVDKEKRRVVGRAVDEQHPAKSRGAAGRDALGEKLAITTFRGQPDLSEDEIDIDAT